MACRVCQNYPYIFVEVVIDGRCLAIGGMVNFYWLPRTCCRCVLDCAVVSFNPQEWTVTFPGFPIYKLYYTCDGRFGERVQGGRLENLTILIYIIIIVIIIIIIIIIVIIIIVIVIIIKQNKNNIYCIVLFKNQIVLIIIMHLGLLTEK